MNPFSTKQNCPTREKIFSKYTDMKINEFPFENEKLSTLESHLLDHKLKHKKEIFTDK